MTASDAMLKKFHEGEFTVGILGLGYVGLPLALVFAEKGHRTLGFDIDAKKVALLRDGESYIQYVGAERIRTQTAALTFEATGDLDRLREPDILIICVPTPLDEHREPDLRYVASTAEEIAKRLRPGQLVVLESTTYPGCFRRSPPGDCGWTRIFSWPSAPSARTRRTAFIIPGTSRNLSGESRPAAETLRKSRMPGFWRALSASRLRRWRNPPSSSKIFSGA